MPLVSFSPFPKDEFDVVDATLPLPDGTAVGLRHFHAIDPSRNDISTGNRQFMVSAFFPAVPDETTPRARLMDVLEPQCELALDLFFQASDLTFQERSARHARCRALTLRAQRDLKLVDAPPYPVLIYYPGGASHRLSNAALCERLACAGYIVFTLDAPRDAPLVVFPDGRIVPFLADNDEDYIWPRVADVRFLLDCLEELNHSGSFAGRLDLNRVGMFGHSRGGYVSNICAVEDARVRAAINMDGFLWGLWAEGTGLQKYPLEFQQRARALQTPILRLCSKGSEAAARVRFEEEARDFGGTFIFGALDEFGHNDFVTVPWLNGTPENWAKSVMLAPPPAESIELLARLLIEFFGTCLLIYGSYRAQLLGQRAGVQMFARYDL